LIGISYCLPVRLSVIVSVSAITGGDDYASWSLSGSGEGTGSLATR
jgi:hypothetical protein